MMTPLLFQFSIILINGLLLTTSILKLFLQQLYILNLNLFDLNNMNLLNAIKNLNPGLKEFVKQSIINDTKSTIGYRCYGIDETGTFSGGTSSDPDIALRIAIAESFERSLVRIINRDEK